MNYAKSVMLGLCLLAMPFSQAGPVSWLWNRIKSYPITTAAVTYCLYHKRVTVKDKIVDPVMHKARNFWENLKRGDRRTWIYSGAALIGAYLVSQCGGNGDQGAPEASFSPYEPLILFGGIVAGGYALYKQRDALFAGSRTAPGDAHGHNPKAPAPFGDKQAHHNPVIVKLDRLQGVKQTSNNGSVSGKAPAQLVTTPVAVKPCVVPPTAQVTEAQKTEQAVSASVKVGSGLVQSPAQDTGAQKTEPTPVGEPKQEVVEIEPELCGLCTDEMLTKDENVVRVGRDCSHFMHKDCRGIIISHARNKKETPLCPLCRTPIVEIELKTSVKQPL